MPGAGRSRNEFSVHTIIASESRWSAGTDDLTHFATDIAEAVWELAGEVISLAGSEDARGAADRQLDPATHHDTRLFAAMSEHFLARRRAASVALSQDRELASRAFRRDEPQRDLFIPDLDELIDAEECLRGGAQVQREEFGERHGHSIEHSFERADGWADAILLDERDEAIRDPGPARQLPLGETKTRADAAQARPDVNAHGRLRF